LRIDGGEAVANQTAKRFQVATKRSFESTAKRLRVTAKRLRIDYEAIANHYLQNGGADAAKRLRSRLRSGCTVVAQQLCNDCATITATIRSDGHGLRNDVQRFCNDGAQDAHNTVKECNSKLDPYLVPSPQCICMKSDTVARVAKLPLLLAIPLNCGLILPDFHMFFRC
jgi:plasmid stabilization system protein ParE